jgi:hypothetical protein
MQTTKPNHIEVHNAILYWLSILPLKEMDDYSAIIAKKYRKGEISIQSAVACLSQYSGRISDWIETNIEIEKTFNLVEDVE